VNYIYIPFYPPFYPPFEKGGAKTFQKMDLNLAVSSAEPFLTSYERWKGLAPPFSKVEKVDELP
jgi:hypothetical protein